METKISVVGEGSWATAPAKTLTANTDQVCWYIRNEQSIEHIKVTKHNPNYLNDVRLNINKLHLINHLNEAVAFSDYIIFCTPSAFLSDELSKLTLPLTDRTIFPAIRGIEPKSGLIIGEYFNKIHRIPCTQIGTIAGPHHAKEVTLERSSYLTIAYLDEGKTHFMAEAMSRHYMKTEILDDVTGIEYATMLKSIYALAVGIAHGSGYGDNLQSALMSSAIRETRCYIRRTYKIKCNINNSVCLGNLLVTSYSLLSRNRTFDTMIDKGYTAKSTMAGMNMVAERHCTTRSAHLINKNREKPSRIPIPSAVHKMPYKDRRARTEFAKLTAKLGQSADLVIVINFASIKPIKAYNVVPAIAINPTIITSHRVLGATGEAPKKELSYYQKKRAIDEIARSTNRNITRRNLMKMILEE